MTADLKIRVATLKEGGRDGRLACVSDDLAIAAPVPGIAATLQAALDDWQAKAPLLAEICAALDRRDEVEGARPFDQGEAACPLPRAYQFLDASAYVVHVELVRRARGETLPESFWTDPLMYQGSSDCFVDPHGPIEALDEAHGIDFEAEVAVITDDVPMGVSAQSALGHVRLVALLNDVSLRGLIPAELKKGFGFLQGKPPSAMSPVAVTPACLGPAWAEGKVHLPLTSFVNGRRIGRPNAGVNMTFDFGRLVAHAAKTRPLAAGTIIGSGTVSNRDRSVGSSCLVEVRMLETFDQGVPSTPFLKFGDRVWIDMQDANGRSIFGTIENEVVRYRPPVT